MQPAARLPPLDVEALFGDLSPEARIKFINNLLTVWRSAFRMSGDHLFSMVVEDAPSPSCRNRGRQHRLPDCAGTPSHRDGDQSGSGRDQRHLCDRCQFDHTLPTHLSSAREKRPAVMPFHREKPQPAPPFLIVLLSKNGLAVRSLPNGKPRHPSLQSWWAKP